MVPTQVSAIYCGVEQVKQDSIPSVAGDEDSNISIYRKGSVDDVPKDFPDTTTQLVVTCTTKQTSRHILLQLRASTFFLSHSFVVIFSVISALKQILSTTLLQPAAIDRTADTKSQSTTEQPIDKARPTATRRLLIGRVQT